MEEMEKIVGFCVRVWNLNDTPPLSIMFCSGQVPREADKGNEESKSSYRSAALVSALQAYEGCRPAGANKTVFKTCRYLGLANILGIQLPSSIPSLPVMLGKRLSPQV